MSRKLTITISDDLESKIEMRIATSEIQGGRLTYADVIRDALDRYFQPREKPPKSLQQLDANETKC